MRLDSKHTSSNYNAGIKTSSSSIICMYRIFSQCIDYPKLTIKILYCTTFPVSINEGILPPYKKNCPDLIIASEMWERATRRLHDIIKNKQFKCVSSYRKNKSPGGGCAIIFNESRFIAS